MKNFFKPRKLNIVDIILFVFIILSISLTYIEKNDSVKSNHNISVKLSGDIFRNYENIQKINEQLNITEYDSVNQSEYNLDIINLIEKGHSSNLERITRLEETLSESLRMIGKINDWTIQTDMVLSSMLSNN